MTDEDLRRVIAETAEQTSKRTRDHFDVVAEGLEHKIQLVAEGVSANTQRIERVHVQVEDLQSGLHREFEEVRSMIRLSYTELDRRLRSLEETVVDLRERMERIESGSTH